MGLIESISTKKNNNTQNQELNTKSCSSVNHDLHDETCFLRLITLNHYTMLYMLKRAKTKGCRRTRSRACTFEVSIAIHYTIRSFQSAVDRGWEWFYRKPWLTELHDFVFNSWFCVLLFFFVDIDSIKPIPAATTRPRAEFYAPCNS